MLGRRSREASPRVSTGAGGFAAKADDLESLRGAVVDAAGVGTGCGSAISLRCSTLPSPPAR